MAILRPTPLAADGAGLARARRDRGADSAIEGYDRILGAARSADVVIRLHAAPGDFVSFDAAVAEVSPPERLTPEVADAIRASHLVARYPSIEHDVRFGTRRLADIAVRALSPGINDPTTATNCVDYPEVILAHLIDRRFPSRYRKADGDRIRVVADRPTLSSPTGPPCRRRPAHLVVADRPTFAAMVHLAFDQIRLYGERGPRVLARLAQTLVHLTERSRDLERVAPLARMAREVATSAEPLHPEWRERMLALVRRVTARDPARAEAPAAARKAGVVH